MDTKAIFTALAVAALATTAQAHSKAETNTPADGAIVAEVPEIALLFDDPMRVISILLTRGEEEVEIERETGMDPVTAFRALPAEPLAPGEYGVEWRGMSADGHPMEGGFAFTVAE